MQGPSEAKSSSLSLSSSSYLLVSTTICLGGSWPYCWQGKSSFGSTGVHPRHFKVECLSVSAQVLNNNLKNLKTMTEGRAGGRYHLAKQD